MPWSVSILPKADQDLEEVDDVQTRRALETALLAEFQGMKGDRVTKLFVQGVSTGSVDKLSSASFPGSIRIQLGDFRATALCLPVFRQAFITHVFHKSRDPTYRRAVAVHESRAAEFVRTFTEFLGRK